MLKVKLQRKTSCHNQKLPDPTRNIRKQQSKLV